MLSYWTLSGTVYPGWLRTTASLLSEADFHPTACACSLFSYMSSLASGYINKHFVTLRSSIQTRPSCHLTAPHALMWCSLPAPMSEIPSTSFILSWPPPEQVLVRALSWHCSTVPMLYVLHFTCPVMQFTEWKMLLADRWSEFKFKLKIKIKATPKNPPTKKYFSPRTHVWSLCQPHLLKDSTFLYMLGLCLSNFFPLIEGFIVW